MRLTTFSLFLTILFFSDATAQHAEPVLLKNASYLFEKFETGNILLKSGRVERALLNYNTIDQNIVFMNNDTVMVLIDLPNVDTIYHQNKKYVPFNNKIFEVVDADVKLYVSYSSKITGLVTTADRGGITKQADSRVSNTVSNTYVNRNYKNTNVYELVRNYWFLSGKELVGLNNEKQLIRKFQPKTDLIRNFVRDNHIDFKKENDIKKLLQFCIS